MFTDLKTESHTETREWKGIHHYDSGVMNYQHLLRESPSLCVSGLLESEQWLPPTDAEVIPNPFGVA